MFARIVLFAALLQITGSAIARPTSMELQEALQLAQQYLVAQKVSNANRYLASVYWHEDSKDAGKNCWTVVWEPTAPVTDGQLFVWVYEDGRIRYQDRWA